MRAGGALRLGAGARTSMRSMLTCTTSGAGAAASPAPGRRVGWLSGGLARRLAGGASGQRRSGRRIGPGGGLRQVHVSEPDAISWRREVAGGSQGGVVGPWRGGPSLQGGGGCPRRRGRCSVVGGGRSIVRPRRHGCCAGRCRSGQRLPGHGGGDRRRGASARAAGLAEAGLRPVAESLLFAVWLRRRGGAAQQVGRGHVGKSRRQHRLRGGCAAGGLRMKAGQPVHQDCTSCK